MTYAADELRRLVCTDRDLMLDDILSRWWASLSPIRLADGHAHAACGFESYQTSRQYDDVNGALDEALEAQMMRQVGHEISELPDPWRSAINALARSLCTGLAVFHSPRIAPEDHARVTAEARERITARLAAAGLL